MDTLIFYILPVPVPFFPPAPLRGRGPSVKGTLSSDKMLFGPAVLLPPALLAVKRAGGPVVNVWWCFAAFQCGRAACFTAAIWGAGLWRRLRPAKVGED